MSKGLADAAGAGPGAVFCGVAGGILSKGDAGNGGDWVRAEGVPPKASTGAAAEGA